MESIKAIGLMVLWTVLSLYALYYALKTLEILTIVPISLSLLGIHMINMFIYFKVGGNKPYEWKKLN